MESPQLDILLTTHNHLNLTINCIEAIYRYTNIPFRLTVIDDSTDETPHYLYRIAEEKGNIQVLIPDFELTSVHLSWNYALDRTDCDIVCCMVNSVVVEPHWLDAAYEIIKNKTDVGIVGFKILNTWGTIQCTSVMGIFDNGSMAVTGKEEAGHRCSYISQVPAIGGAVFLLRREAFRFDPTLYIGYRGWDDIDMCLRVRSKGWDVIYCGYGVVYHIDSPTKKENSPRFWEEYEENLRRFRERWKFKLENVKR